jgi:hypothetical protein
VIGRSRLKAAQSLGHEILQQLQVISQLQPDRPPEAMEQIDH